MATGWLMCLALAGCCAPALPAEGVRPAADQEKIFFYGFEREKTLADWLKPYDEQGEVCHLIWPGDRGRCTQAIKKGDATEGQWAAVIDIGTGSLPTRAGSSIPGSSWKRSRRRAWCTSTTCVCRHQAWPRACR